jgi:3-deoxy-D-manno-octulosonate 8-phosphate phosphatase (KDO 8-P phosphatase)
MNLAARFEQINTFIFDIDGVLTDGSLIVAESGALLRTMNIKDGYALQLAVKKNYRIIIISGGNSLPAAERLKKLGVQEIFMNVSDKAIQLRALIDTTALNPENTLYMGDDMPDLEAMQMVALACCPADACYDVLNASTYVSPNKGGHGAVRDVLEKVLKLRNDWE